MPEHCPDSGAILMCEMNAELNLNKQKLRKILAIFGLGCIYFIFVKFTGLSIPCPFRLISGGRILCPGCGISRMCMSLASLDIHGAFTCNPAIFSMLPFWTICVILWLFDRRPKFVNFIEIISIIILLAFGILRNIF